MKNARIQTTEASALDKDHSTPSYPTHGTQAARLLAVALLGQEINPLTGWRSLGIYRLSDTVYQLRGMGWPVITGRLDVANRYNETCHVALYRLPAEAINQAGDKGQEFARRELELMNSRKAA